eukprot:maker-scaffold604_size126151-snap-gene-0.28 protein:Tk08219 transcript:maker-scaffold604_size126151-snap-gene-0.28-mRNA-1 annotation:"dis3-like exonuclease 2 isoform x2"
MEPSGSAAPDPSPVAGPKKHRRKRPAKKPVKPVKPVSAPPTDSRVAVQPPAVVAALASRPVASPVVQRHGFAPHFPVEVARQLLSRSPADFVRGPFRINAKSYQDAFVSHPDPQCPDIHIRGLIDRNRAMHGDEVVVRLRARDQWHTLPERITEYLAELRALTSPDAALLAAAHYPEAPEAPPASAAAEADVVVESVRQLRLTDPGVDPEPAQTVLTQFQARFREHGGGREFYPLAAVQAHPKWAQFLQPTAEVLCILDPKHTRLAAGRLRKYNDHNPNYALFAPEDSRVPRMKVARADCPPDFFARPDDFTDLLFIGQIIQWEQPNAASGKIVKTLGDYSDVHVITEGILDELQVDCSEFPEAIKDALPAIPYVIPESEIQARRDFRDECVFTIDPMTARDLDDALSVIPMSGQRVKIAVHIADVSHFVTQNSLVDEIARERSTSVYLVQRVIPMLPRTLCEDLCSLNPAEDRLTFSVEWILDENANILEEWMGKTVIRSCAKLAYEHAQSMLDHPNQEWTTEEMPSVESPWTYQDLSTRVTLLNQMALKLRAKRVEAGALRLDNPTLAFSLDGETGLPQGYKLYEHRHSNKLIEEFMLFANISVAKKLKAAIPELAVLRCHPPPKPRFLDGLVRKLARFGVPLDGNSSHAIAQSVTQYEANHTRSERQLFLNMISKSMELAMYVCAGCCEDHQLRHYALAQDLYTHFTSPIRRYPDILVHRLLQSVLTNEVPNWDKNEVRKWLMHCNDKKVAAKRASDQSAQVYLAMFIKMCGPITADAIVMDVGDKSFDVLIPTMAVVKRIFLDKLEGCESKLVKTHNPYLVLKWKPKLPEFPGAKVENVTLFSQISVTAFYDQKPHQFRVVMNRHDEDHRILEVFLAQTVEVHLFDLNVLRDIYVHEDLDIPISGSETFQELLGLNLLKAFLFRILEVLFLRFGQNDVASDDFRAWTSITPSAEDLTSPMTI